MKKEKEKEMNMDMDMEPDSDHLVENFSDSFCTCVNFINCCNSMTAITDINRILDFINIMMPFRTCAVFQAEINSHNIITDYNKIKHRSENEFWENYTKSGLLKIDPVIAQSIKNSTPIKWKDTYTAYRNKQHDTKIEKLIKRTEDHNLQHGVTFSFNTKDSPHIFIIFSLCIKSYNYDDVSIHRLDVLLPYTYAPIHKFFHSRSSRNHTLEQNLTSREREVLKWVTQGKTSWETGKILSITERTVKFHLNNTYHKLNVTNRTQAITTALNHGLI